MGPTWEIVAKLSLNLCRKAVAALEQCVRHETGAGSLAGGMCFVSNDALDGNLARSAGRVVDTIDRSPTPGPAMGRRCGRFLSETKGVYVWKKNLMLAAIRLINFSFLV